MAAELRAGDEPEAHARNAWNERTARTVDDATLGAALRAARDSLADKAELRVTFAHGTTTVEVLVACPDCGMQHVEVDSTQAYEHLGSALVDVVDRYMRSLR
jgi:hypothetical protein